MCRLNTFIDSHTCNRSPEHYVQGRCSSIKEVVTFNIHLFPSYLSETLVRRLSPLMAITETVPTYNGSRYSAVICHASLTALYRDLAPSRYNGVPRCREEINNAITLNTWPYTSRFHQYGIGTGKRDGHPWFCAMQFNSVFRICYSNTSRTYDTHVWHRTLNSCFAPVCVSIELSVRSC